MEQMTGASRASDVSEVTRENIVPLNSRQLTGTLLKQLAAELGVPTSASYDDLRLMISGKLEEVGREPMNVQVVLRKSDEAITVSLRDVEGIFLVAKPLGHDEESEGRVDGSGEQDDVHEGDSVETLKEALRVQTEEKGAPQEQVDSLKSKLESMEVRMKEIWRSSCAQLAEFDAIVTAKDEEIALLREQFWCEPQSFPASHHLGEDDGISPGPAIAQTSGSTKSRRR